MDHKFRIHYQWTPTVTLIYIIMWFIVNFQLTICWSIMEWNNGINGIITTMTVNTAETPQNKTKKPFCLTKHISLYLFWIFILTAVQFSWCSVMLTPPHCAKNTVKQVILVHLLCLMKFHIPGILRKDPGWEWEVINGTVQVCIHAASLL